MSARETIERTIARYLRLPEEADDCTDEVLRALDAAGLAVVPKEASAEMIAAMADSRASEDEWLLAPLRDMIGFCAEDRGDGILRAAYRAMIAAAPDGGPK